MQIRMYVGCFYFVCFLVLFFFGRHNRLILIENNKHGHHPWLHASKDNWKCGAAVEFTVSHENSILFLEEKIFIGVYKRQILML